MELPAYIEYTGDLPPIVVTEPAKSEPAEPAKKKEKRRREPMIVTFAADGRRLRDHSLIAIQHLLSVHAVVVDLRPDGKINYAQFRGQGGANPVSKTAHMGQQYSFQRAIGNYQVWQHRDLLKHQDIEEFFGVDTEAEDPKVIDLFLQRVFRAVPLSCMNQPAPPSSTKKTRPARKVVDINSYRRQRPVAARPIEFDSERRAA